MLPNFPTDNRQILPNDPVVQKSFMPFSIYQPVNRNFYQNSFISPGLQQFQNAYLESQQNFQKPPLNVVSQNIQEHGQDYGYQLPGVVLQFVTDT